MKYLSYFLTSILVTVVTVQAQPLTFNVSGGKDNLIRFESKAPLETIVGTTDQVKGTITLDPTNLSQGVSVAISVAAATLKTGNSMRDGHMRNNHLETDQYPEIRFILQDSTLTGSLAGGGKRHFEVPGEFSLHGVTKPITVPVEVILFEEGAQYKLHIVAKFQVGLSEYEIPRPQFLVLKLDEIQHITVDIWGATL